MRDLCSRDGGMTWSDIYADSTLIEPICQASMLNYTFYNTERTLLHLPRVKEPEARFIL